jgi:hypothetical protein
MYWIIAILAVISIPSIIKKIKSELRWKEWKSDVHNMTDTRINAVSSSINSNQKLDELNARINKETNPQEKARLQSEINQIYMDSEISWAEHEMNHTANYNAIREKYNND